MSFLKCRNVLSIINNDVDNDDELELFKKIFTRKGSTWNQSKKLDNKWLISFFSFGEPPIDLITKCSSKFQNLTFELAYFLPDTCEFFCGKNIIRNGENKVEKYWDLTQNINGGEEYAKNLLIIFFPEVLERINRRFNKLL